MRKHREQGLQNTIKEKNGVTEETQHESLVVNF